MTDSNSATSSRNVKMGMIAAGEDLSGVTRIEYNSESLAGAKGGVIEDGSGITGSRDGTIGQVVPTTRETGGTVNINASKAMISLLAPYVLGGSWSGSGIGACLPADTALPELDILVDRGPEVVLFKESKINQFTLKGGEGEQMLTLDLDFFSKDTDLMPDIQTGSANAVTDGANTVVTTTGDAFDTLLVGAMIMANNQVRRVLAKASANSITVDYPVDWDNSAAGYEFKYSNPITWPDLPETNVYVHCQSTLLIDSVEYKYKSLSLTINNNLERSYLNNRTATALPEGKREVSGELVFNYNPATRNIYKEMISGATISPVSIIDTYMDANGNTFKITMASALLDVSKADPGASGDTARQEITIPFTAKADPSEPTPSVKFELIDA